MKEYKVLTQVGIYIAIYVSAVLAFMLVSGIGANDSIRAIQLVMQLLILGSLLFAGFKGYKKELDTTQILYLIIVIGMIMRIGYMLYTPMTVRSHDLDDIVGVDQAGHMGYINQLLGGHLPQSNEYQFYHPPLFHFLAAKSCLLVNFFLRKTNRYDVLEASKVVSCFASCSMLILAKRISEELGLKEKAKLFVVAFIAFLPNFYLLAGRVNNDSLAIFFMFIIVLYTIKWYKNASYTNVIVIALAFGLGMMSKISVGMFAVYTGSIMLYILFKDPNRSGKKKIFFELSTFAVICFPLALWYPIRNKILFDQPFTYVSEIPIDHPLYCGDHAWYQRLLGLPFNKTMSLIYNSSYEDYNVNVYLIKSALFGEFTFTITPLISSLLLISYVLLTAIIVFLYVYITYSYSKTKTLAIYTTVGITALMYLSHIYFNVRDPFGCTMDFRYIVPIALANALALGMGMEAMTDSTNKIVKGIRKIALPIFMAFMILSVVMFCNIGTISMVLGS